MSKRQTKLQRAVHALGEISFLDQRPDATLPDAVRLAEQALQDIERDWLRIDLKRTRKGGLTVHINSAAGNEAIAREVATDVQKTLDAIVVELGGKPFKWGAATHRGRKADDEEEREK